MKHEVKKMVLAALTAALAVFGAVNVVGLTAFAGEPEALQLWEGGPYWATVNVGTSEVQDHPEYGALYNFDNATNEVAKLGNGWRLPTKEDFDKLVDTSYCTGTWDATKKGYTFTGATDGYKDKSIFLPAAGSDSTSDGRRGAGGEGNYWSSEEEDANDVWSLEFYGSSLLHVAGTYHSYRLSVRAVRDTPPPKVEVSNLQWVQMSGGDPRAQIDFNVKCDVGGTNLVFEVAAYSKDRATYFTDGDISVDNGQTYTQDVLEAFETAGATQEVHLVWNWQKHNPDLDWDDVTIEVTAKVQGEDVAVKCQNGIFVGVRDSLSGVVAFKSVPYAKPPTKETGLRWKPPVKPDDSDAVVSARHFGPAAAQTREAEHASCGPVSEDCLRLSIWTAGRFEPTDKRPVMFYIHGGSYGWGGMCDPLYDGERLVRDNPDVILVSCDYRLNAFGYLDLTGLPGYDPEKHKDYDQAPNLGILDLQAGLRWVQENIAQFGGDPENVTIFGESAGGGSVSCLLQAKGSDGLFRRAIVMSGTLDLTDSPETYKASNQAYCLMKAAGKSNIDELLACSTEELVAALETSLDDPSVATVRHLNPREGLMKVAGLNNRPMCDDVRGIVASDPFAASATNAIAKGVDVMIGTTSEENNYWASLMFGFSREGALSLDDPLGYYHCTFVSNSISRSQTLFARVGNETNVTAFLEGPGASHPFDLDPRFNLGGLYPNIWGRTELMSELSFRIPSIIMAERHGELVRTSGGAGKTYMYYFCRPQKSITMPWVGACHASELTSVFKNTHLDVDGADKGLLAERVSGAFVSFAKTGNPGENWAEYDTTDRKTTVIGRKGDFEDAELRIESDPDGMQRELLEPDFLAYRAEKLRTGDATAFWHGLRHVAPYLHEIWYDDYVFCADGSCFTTGMVSACSSVRKGNFHGRNMDYFLWDSPEFVVHVAAKPSVGRLASVGVARQSAMRESGVLAGTYRESYETLPNWILDGVNEKRVVVNCNVVPQFDCGALPLENPDPNSTLPLHVVEIPRYLLDYATNAAHAVELLKAREGYVFGSGGGNYLLHFMVSDPKETVVIEFINGKVVARRQDIMTNFNVNWDNETRTDVDDSAGWGRNHFWSIEKFVRGTTDVAELKKLYTPCAMGIERYGELLANYDGCGQSLDNMMALMRRVQYTKMYDKDNPHFWYSEWCEYDEEIRNEDFYSMSWNWGDGSKLDEWIQSGLDAAAYDLADFERARTNLAERSQTWITGHACAYDIEKRMFRMIVQEDYEHTYDFWLVPMVKVSLPSGIQGGSYVVSNLTENVEIVASGSMLGAATYELPIGAKVAIYLVPSEGYVVSGTNPYVIDKVTSEASVDPTLVPTAVDYADTVVYGTIRTAEKGNAVVEAVAIKDGKYVYVGDEDGAAAFVKDGVTKVVDHRGKGMVMPGCTDGHSHYAMKFGLANMKGGVMFAPEDDKAEVLQKLKAAAGEAKAAGKKSLFGFGWNIVTLLAGEDDPPTLKELDDATNGEGEGEKISMVILDSGGHHAFCNSECLLRCGIIDGKGGVLVKKIPGGYLELDENDYPTGYAEERAMGYLMRMGGIDYDELMDDEVAEISIRKTRDLLLSTGYTAALEGWSNILHSNKLYAAAKRLDENGELNLVFPMTYEVEPWMSDAEMSNQIDYLDALNETYATDHVQPKYLKIFMDGVVETKTGAMLKPYKDDQEYYRSFWSTNRLADITRACNAKDLTVHVHTMGDAAIRDTVTAYIMGGDGTHRNCLVHLRNVSTNEVNDFERMAANNIACSAGFTWHVAGKEAELMEIFLEKDYIEHAYPIKSFFDAGVKVSSHSDYPANEPCPQDPFGLMEVALTGQRPDLPEDEKLPPYDTNELVTVEQVFEALTINGAWQLGLEKERGSIAVGKWADFVLADQDVFECATTDIHKTKVVSTWFEGEQVYEAARALTVKNVKFQQRYPWNGLVDIGFGLTGPEGATNVVVTVSDGETTLANFTAAVTIPEDGVLTTNLVWDADAAGLAANFKSDDVTVEVAFEEDNTGPVQLWAGGPYFAQCNVGATRPEEYGFYFWWGDTVGYTNNNAAVNADKKWLSVKDGTTPIQFSSSDATAKQTYKKDLAALKSEGWTGEDGNLIAEHDAATAHLGAPWRMMTKAELDCLVANCEVEWTDNRNETGIKGTIVKGKGDYSANSIFLPAAGWGYESSLNDAGLLGFYWSSTPNSDDSIRAWGPSFNSDEFCWSCYYRYYGQSVRPVRDAAVTPVISAKSAAGSLDLTVGDRVAKDVETLVIDPAWGAAATATVIIEGENGPRQYTCASNDLWQTASLEPGRYAMRLTAGEETDAISYSAAFWKIGADWVVFDGSNITENTAFEADKTYLILGTNTVADSKTLTVEDGAKFEYAAGAGFLGGTVVEPMPRRYMKETVAGDLYRIVEVAKGSADNPWVIGNDGETPSPHEVEAWTNGTELVIGGKGTITDLSAIPTDVKGGITAINVASNGVAGVASGAFQGVGDGEIALTLPDNWQGELPDKSGNWYGATGVTLTAYPLAVRNIQTVTHWPWDGKIDITCDLTGTGVVQLAAALMTNGVTVCEARNLTGRTLIDLDDAGGATNGVTFVWNAKADFVAAGLADFNAENAVIKVTAEKPKTDGDYMVIDLSSDGNGRFAVSYEDMDVASAIEKYNTDEYKTGKLVLKKIPAGTAYPCEPRMSADVTSTPISGTMTPAKDYFIGLFETTVAQYDRVMGVEAPSDATIPKNCISYNMIRGGDDSWDIEPTDPVAAESFMGILAAKTGVAGFDLPTEIQWEIAARAGSTAEYGSYLGEDGSAVAGVYNSSAAPWGNTTNFMWFAKNNNPAGVKSVGLLRPNLWGLYDTAGNVYEFCLDVYNEDKTSWDDVETPEADGDSYMRSLRGGYFAKAATVSRPSVRASGYSDSDGISVGAGFRLCRTAASAGSSTSATATSTSEAFACDLREEIALDSAVRIEGVSYSDTAWGTAAKANVALGWTNETTDATGVFDGADDLEDDGELNVTLPKKNGDYRLTHSTGGLTSFVTFTVSGCPKYSTKITLDPTGGTGGTKTVTATYGKALPPASAPTRRGYMFSGYFDATNGGRMYYDASMTSQVTWWSDRKTYTLYAQWARVSTVTINKAGGTSGTSKVIVTNGVMPRRIGVPTREGYALLGIFNKAEGGAKYWNADGTGARVWNGKAASYTFYAHWARVSTVTINKAGGGPSGTSKVIVTNGVMPRRIGVPTREGYALLGIFNKAEGGAKYWNADGTGARVWNGTAASYTFYAQWLRAPYDITVKVGGELAPDESGPALALFDGAAETGWMPAGTATDWDLFVTYGEAVTALDIEVAEDVVSAEEMWLYVSEDASDWTPIGTEGDLPATFQYLWLHFEDEGGVPPHLYEITVAE